MSWNIAESKFRSVFVSSSSEINHARHQRSTGGHGCGESLVNHRCESVRARIGRYTKYARIVIYIYTYIYIYMFIHMSRFVNTPKNCQTYLITRQILLTWMHRCCLALSFFPSLLNYWIAWLTYWLKKSLQPAPKPWSQGGGWVGGSPMVPPRPGSPGQGDPDQTSRLDESALRPQLLRHAMPSPRFV